MTPACAIGDVPLGEGRAVVLGGVRIALFNTLSGWYALDAVCPHKGGPLEDGIVSGSSVLCPLHDRAFDLATGSTQADCASVNAYEVELRDDQVFVDVRARVSRPA
jgi:nitrite reductase (NADH) small subunit